MSSVYKYVMFNSFNAYKFSLFQVHFAEEGKLQSVHHIDQWSDEYQEARKGHWQQFYLDRQRFMKRVKDTEEILAPILAKDHRDKVLLQHQQYE